MGAEKTIRNRNRQIIAYVITESNGNKKILDFYRRILGTYDAGTDTTRDFYGRIVAYGDACAAFVGDKLL
ncbi:MAG: hypothetical protein J5760_02825 [Clostridia bacterium]|nr:hypothetical protein [Clostridia bacterium]